MRRACEVAGYNTQEIRWRFFSEFYPSKKMQPQSNPTDRTGLKQEDQQELSAKFTRVKRLQAVQSRHRTISRKTRLKDQERN
jgi:hypothetical protein